MCLSSCVSLSHPWFNFNLLAETKCGFLPETWSAHKEITDYFENLLFVVSWECSHVDKNSANYQDSY